MKMFLKPLILNTLRARQIGHHYVDDIVILIFWRKSRGILIQISSKIVP